jgi:hypothetical protein
MKANEKSWYSDGQLVVNEEPAKCHDRPFETDDSGIAEDQTGATVHPEDKSDGNDEAALFWPNLEVTTGSRLCLQRQTCGRRSRRVLHLKDKLREKDFAAKEEAPYVRFFR